MSQFDRGLMIQMKNSSGDVVIEVIDTPDNRIEFWPNNISNAQGPVPNKLYDYD